MSAEHLQVVPDLPEPVPVPVPVACNRCGHITEAVVIIRAIRADWVVATFTDDQAQIRDNHCKENQP